MRVYVFGGGGHAKVVIGTLLELGMAVEGVFDDCSDKWGDEILGIKILGPIRKEHRLAALLASLLWEIITHVHG